MASVKQCDRCRAVYSEQDGEAVLLKEWNNRSGVHVNTFDLCCKCKDDFHLKFMKAMTETENSNGD